MLATTVGEFTCAHSCIHKAVTKLNHYVSTNYPILCIPTDIDMGNTETGSPLIQMMLYASIKQTEESLPRPNIEVSIVKWFVDNGTVLSRVLRANDYDNSTALEFAITFQRLDIVQVLIEAGADPILCGDGVFSPLVIEYSISGTNNFVRWLLDNKSNIPAFIDRVLETGVLFRPEMKDYVLQTYGRSPVHAFLLSRHEETIQYLVQQKPELLEETDASERTALHVAAEEGDLESIKILLEWSDTSYEPKYCTFLNCVPLNLVDCVCACIVGPCWCV